MALTMKATIIYGFESGQIATRFLNRVRANDFRGVRASFCNGGVNVRITYPLGDSSDYDSTCSELDDMASMLSGVEISHS